MLLSVAKVPSGVAIATASAAVRGRDDRPDSVESAQYRRAVGPEHGSDVATLMLRADAACMPPG